MNESVAVTANNGVAVVMLNRADAFNAFDLEMGERFARHLVTLASDRRTRGIVISGAGKAFCAGGDLKWALSQESGAPAAFHELAGHFHLAITEMRRMPKPVIAAINGVAAGGGFSLALACDFRVMAKSAVLKQAYTSSGLCLDGGGTFTLPRIVDDGTALEAGIKMAEELAQKSLNAFGAAKQLLTDSFDTPFETQIERERKALSACAEHPEGQEGLKAFSEKRKPRYGSR
jgi:2-(1,2-epoxy-1,2-dihydrophenyl)acetyl-CoA isomerase